MSAFEEAGAAIAPDDPAQNIQRNVRREKIGALLLDERGLFPFGFCRVVSALRVLPLLDLAFDDAFADLHAQVIDRGLLRQREHVDSLAPVRGRIDEALRDARTRRHAGDIDVNVGEKKWRSDFRLAIEQQRALLRVSARRRRVRLRRDDEHCEPQYDADERARRNAFQQQPAEITPFGTNAHVNAVDSLPAAHCRHPRSIRDPVSPVCMKRPDCVVEQEKMGESSDQ